VLSARALRGPNVWTLAPALVAEVRSGSLFGDVLKRVGFAERMLDAVPTIEHQPCTRHPQRRFGASLRDGTSLAHVLEHLAIELQNLAGCNVTFGRVTAGGAGTRLVVVGYEEEELGVESVHAAARIIRACVQRESIDLAALIADLLELRADVGLGPSTLAVVDAARRRGIPVRRLNDRSRVQLGLGCHLRRIQATMSDRTSAIAVELAKNKHEAKRVLRAAGLPAPSGEVHTSLADALEFAGDVGYPLILKPVDGNHGRGVSPRVDDAAGLERAWHAASEFSARVIVERFHAGRDHRVLVVGNRVVACAERVPAHVVGDGTSTIAQLIDEANADPRRGPGHTKMLTLIPADDVTSDMLREQGKTLDAIPLAGERVVLRATANLSTGGTSIDRTDEMHPDNVAACEVAAAAIGLDIAGLDIITDDISVPFRDNGAVIIEVNAAPGLRMHTQPSVGEPRDAGAAIVDMLYPDGRPSRIPVVAITGTNGKTTTARLIAHLFRQTGERVGFTTTDGVYLHDRLIMPGDMTGPVGAAAVLSNPAVTFAVLETARGGILRAGLGFEECDTAVVLNVAGDHLGLGGVETIEQLAHVKGVVPAVARDNGFAVLNADDPLVFAMRERTRGSVVLFSASDEPGENVEAHRKNGGIAACLDEGAFVVDRGSERTIIARETDVPLMAGGAARFQRQNVLAAIAVAYVMGMHPADIGAGLRSLEPSTEHTPGRLNSITTTTGARIIVDYAHNAAAVEAFTAYVATLPAARKLGVVAMPGDRRNEDIRGVGERWACFDHVVIKEDHHLRGREPGEVASLLREGLVRGGLDPSAIEYLRDESDAVRHAISLLAPGDLLVVFADDVPETLRIVAEHAHT